MLFRSNNTEEFAELSTKLRSVLDGNYEIKWNGRILGFWLDMQGDEEVETVVGEEKTLIYDIPQKVIQSLLLKDNIDKVEYVDIDSKDVVEDKEQQEKIRERERILDEEIAIIQTGKAKRIRISEVPRAFVASINEPEHVHAGGGENKHPDVEGREGINTENVNGRTPSNDNNTNNETSKESVTIKEFSNKEQKLASDLKIVETMEEVNLDDVRVLIGKNKTMSDVYWEFGSPQMANRQDRKSVV